MIITEDNGVGGKRYLTDSIGGGAVLFDTSIAPTSELLEALSMELGIELYEISSATTAKEAFLMGMLLSYRSENQRLLEGKLPESIVHRYGHELTQYFDAIAADKRPK